MKIVVFGAAGGIGSQFVEQALAAHHEITAYVHTTTGRLIVNQPHLDIIHGDVLDLVSVEAAVQGQDAVISTFGVHDNKKQADVYTKGMSNITYAMSKQSVSRLICVSCAAVDSADEMGLLYDKVIEPLLLKQMHLQMRIMEDNVRQSNLEWTIISPVTLNDELHTSNYRTSTDTLPKDSKHISRSDVADLLLKEVSNNQNVHKRVIVTD